MVIKKDNSDNFYQKITSLALKHKFPLKAIFELTYRCNFRCIHCYVASDKKKNELTTAEIKQVLDQLKNAGCFHIGFTGGEPLIRKDLFEVLNYAKINGFRISLLTNGFLINKNIAKKIASLGTSLNRVDISVLGATKETFEKITGKKGSFGKVLNSIKLLKAEGVDVQIKATLMKPNKDEFLMIKELAEKFDTMFRYGSTINPRINGDKSPLKYQVEPETVYKLMKKLNLSRNLINEEVLEGWNPDNGGRKKLFKCGAGQSEVTISPYGEMNLCLEIPYPQYNILKGPFMEGWKKIKEFVKNFKPSKDYFCRDCVLAQFCNWCPAKGLLAEGALNRCTKQDRDQALFEAKHSPLWEKIAPGWKMQKKRFI